MRKLNRNIIPAPAALDANDENGLTEKDRAIAFFSRKEIPKGEKFKYDAYNHPTVKPALAKISHNKCAYCEATTLEGQDGDIEHFRPKGEIIDLDEEPIKPGYYWLGSSWENLHLSCIHCNQWRIHDTDDGGTISLGKKNQFPLSEKEKRILKHDQDLKDEEPFRLLIDPCLDNPEELLMFDSKGIIYPTKKPDGTENEKGKATIGVFALQRPKLVRAREDYAVAVRLAVKSILKTCEKHKKAIKANKPKAEIDEIADEIKQEMDELKAMTSVKQRFSLFAYCVINEQLAPYGIQMDLKAE